MLSPEQMKENFQIYCEKIKERISEPRATQLIDFVNQYEERFIMMPASAKNWHHSSYPGGYLDHCLRVLECADKMYEVWKSMGGDTSTYTKEEYSLVALFHDLGKMGFDQEDGHYYEPNDSDWHVKNLGQVYKFNTLIPAMKVPERTLFIMQNQGIKLSLNETLAIKLHDGLYDESNKFYFMSGQKETRLRTHLPYLIHHADHMASQIEFEMWNNEGKELKSTKKPTKLPNASKAYKTDKKSKALSEIAENHPKFSKNTSNVINSFFKD